MPRIAKAIANVLKAPKANPEVKKKPVAKPKCTNCDDSGKVCSVCRTGYDA